MLPVASLSEVAVRECLDAAASVGAARTGTRPAVSLSGVAAAFTSERHVLIGGTSLGGGFAPLSTFWATADGWVRTHANYPWHRAALLAALGADESGVGDALSELAAVDAQERVVAAGGLAVAVRSAEEWRAGPVARAAALRPLIESEVVGDAPAREWAGSAGQLDGRPAGLPLAGVRVLDLTRVIAGPVCTRMLAALGADVLRLDPPALPELPLHIADGLVGKRSAFLDATVLEQRSLLDRLVHEADIVVCGYRPGSLDRHGLYPAAVAARHPGAVVVTVSAWGSTGPWGDRRGFDSLVQAACGIGMLCSADGETPGALPCQFLDHATGYLAAAGAMQALVQQRTDGGTHGVWLSLARTSQWLLEASADGVAFAVPGAIETQTLGDLTVPLPPGSLDGVALRWPGGRPEYGASEPAWLPR